jgi:hypothetical protein
MSVKKILAVCASTKLDKSNSEFTYSRSQYARIAIKIEIGNQTKFIILFLELCHAYTFNEE